MKKIFKFLIVLLPNKLKIYLYKKIFNFKIGNNVNIGFSYIDIKNLSLLDNTKIGHFNVIKGLDYLELGNKSIITNFNWITGFPTEIDSKHFEHQPDRSPRLILGNDSAITNRHIIDCTNAITIGSFTTIAGFRSQFLTHSINIKKSIQDSNEITIGSYCFIGTNSIFLPGASVPDYSIVSASSMVKDKLSEEYSIYAGNPAKKVNKSNIKEYKYFSRINGYVL